ncbi:MAG: Na+/H+ antiporter subunit E, partial [Lachnospiraceae bacterium]|nr:Na+/H+ antiporter subunit E [Lachnospiraceae bacterium]
KVLRFGKEASPAIVSFDVTLKTEVGRALLANSITLTPGTITVSLSDNHYVVHCLDKAFGEGLDSSVFVRLIADMEQDYERFMSKRTRKGGEGK